MTAPPEKRSLQGLVQNVAKRSTSFSSNDEDLAPLDDDEFLARWNADLLSSEERNDLELQLLLKPRLREYLAQLIHGGVLTWDDANAMDVFIKDERVAGATKEQTSDFGTAPVTKPSSDVLPVKPPDTTLLPVYRRPLVWALASIAAAVSACYLLWNPSDPEPTLQMAQKHLDRNDFKATIQSLANLNRATLTQPQQTKFDALYSQAIAPEIKEALTNKKFNAATKLSNQAESRGVHSAKISNMGIQARRKLPGENSLELKSLIVDYDFKRGPPGDQNRIEDAYIQSLKRHPDSDLLRANYGQWLLTQGQFHAARQQFNELSGSEELASLSGLGVGLAALGEHQVARTGADEKLREAAERFETLALTEKSADAFFNLGIVQLELHEKKKAVDAFKAAIEKTEPNSRVSKQAKQKLAELMNETD